MAPSPVLPLPKLPTPFPPSGRTVLAVTLFATSDPNLAITRAEEVRLEFTAAPVKLAPQPAASPLVDCILPPIPRTESPAFQPAPMLLANEESARNDVE